MFEMFLQILCLAFLIPAALVCVYYNFLAVYALLSGKAPSPPEAKPKHRFAVLIPAHNEENEISKALDSCNALDYPKEMFRVYVIADNCSDSTAEIATRL